MAEKYTNKTLPLLSASEVAKHNTKKSLYVTLKNRFVYDVTSFIYEHPGGDDLILKYGGKDVSEIMDDLTSHKHSESSYEILEEMIVGFLATAEEEDKLLLNNTKIDVNKNVTYYELTGLSCEEDLSVKTDFKIDYKNNQFIDLEKPLLMQVLFGGFSKEFYLNQVHRPRHYGKGSAPIFGNILEPLSLTPWWVIPCIWIPADLYGISIALRGLNWYTFIPLYCIGLFIWTFVEYLLHRFLFHIDYYLPDNSVALSLHFLLHGVHHYLPMDRYRLVMPPTLFVILAYPFYRLAIGILPYYIGIAVYTGGILGYIMYDCTHYFLHHVNLPAYFQGLKSHHMQHHYKNYELGYGVTSKFWDVIFGTELVDTSPAAAAMESSKSL